jgi:ribonuclease HI
MSIHVWFDGGSLNNQSKNRQGYGSFLTMYNGQLQTMTIDRGTKDERRLSQCHLEFGNKTNNEAEWATFVAALNYAWSIQSSLDKPQEFVFHGDSQNVLGPFIDGTKVKAEHLKPLFEDAKALVYAIEFIKFIKETDTEVKRILGH